MQRLVILWLTVGLLTRATHARHNITAALVALAPVLNNDQETALSMDGRNESSVLSVAVSYTHLTLPTIYSV